MRYQDTSDDHQPLLWWRDHGLYAAHVLVVAFVVSLLITTVLLATGAYGFLGWLTFDSERVWRGEVWRVFTYGFVNPPSLMFVVHMALMLWFGREVEKFFGRRTFLKFYAILYLLTPMLFTAIGLWKPMTLGGVPGGFALFIAFATLYPNAVMIFNILAKWAAFALVGIYTLIAMSNRDLIALASLWATAGFAHGYVRYAQGVFRLPALPSFRRRSVSTEGTAGARRNSPTARTAERPRDFMKETDALLDKIARTGLESLTPAERAQLARAQERLKQRRSG